MFERVVSAIFPRRCAICDEAIQHNQMICVECSKKIRPLSGEICAKCGKRLADEEKVFCFDCSRKVHSYDRGFAVFEYEDVRKSLYRFKYAGRAEYARFYAMAAWKTLGDVLLRYKADALLPVPIHRKREAKRGYNQAREFALELGKYIKVPVIDNYIIRKKRTIPLKKLSESERRNNLKGAFIIARNDVKYKTIIVIDDIYTTGSTIDTISELLRSAGCEKIYFVTVAIGRGL